MCCRVRAGAGLVGVAFWRGYLFSSYQELTRVRGGGGVVTCDGACRGGAQTRVYI